MASMPIWILLVWAGLAWWRTAVLLRQEREQVRSLKDRLETSTDGWGRDQRQMFNEMRRADRAEARLRYFGHEVP